MHTQGSRNSRDRRPTGGPGARRVAVTVFVATLLAGCTWREGMIDAAARAFANSHAGCQPTVRERSDLETGYMAHADADHPDAQGWRGMYEATGCNSDVIYACSPARAHHNGSFSPVECSAVAR